MPLRLSILIVLATLCVGMSAHAAPRVSSSKMGDFARVSFGWDVPTAMKFSTSGSVVTLSFAKPVGPDVSTVASRLRPYVRGITRTPDGSRVMITLDKPYRVRQFLSGNTNGIDIIVRADEPQSTENVADLKAPDEVPSIMTTKKPVPKPVAPKKPAAQAAPVAKPVEPVKPNILTTKKEPAPTVQAAPKTPEPITTKAPEPKPAEPVKAAEVPAKPAATEPTKVEPAKKEAEKPSATVQSKQGELLVGAVKDTTAPTLEFAWTNRVALATFSRGNDAWVIFSKEANINLGRLISVLPKGLVHVDRFALQGHTALRFSSQSPVYPSAEHIKDTYHWRITFAAVPVSKNPIEYTMQPSTQGDFMLFKALDISAPVAFYDPVFGDRWLIAPLYDDAHHIAIAKSIAGSDVVATGQGIAVRTDDDTLAMRVTRGGIELRGKRALPALVRMPIVPGQKELGYVSGAADDIVLAYHKFYKDSQDFAASRARIARELAEADETTRPEKLHELAGIYIAQGFGPEAAKILNDLVQDYPDYYAKMRLGIMHTAAYFMADRMPESLQVLAAAKMDATVPEVQLWNEVMALFTPTSQLATITAETVASTETAEKKTADGTAVAEAPKAPPPPKATLDLLKYQDDIVRFYPPRIRQKLSIIAADQYIQQKQYIKAVALFDALNEDNILKPIQPFAEYLFGRIAADKGDTKRAIDVWQKLVKRDEDPYITARAEFASISLAYTQGEMKLDDAIKRLEALRLDWRYDALEQELLRFLGQLYVDNKQYDLALRVWKELLNYYPGSADALELNIVMTDLFMQLYTEGLADDLPPLKSLALFYEFRDLIPVDSRGDAIVRGLADRLAAVDLVDRAIALLAHQIRFRSEGQERAELGTRLALLYIINDQPDEALQTLEATSYGDIPEKLARLRSQLSAQALEKSGAHEQALQALQGDETPRGRRLKLDIVWSLSDWPNVINVAEDALALRKDFTAPLTNSEQNTLLRLTLAYSFESNTTQLQYLRDYYMNLFPAESKNKPIFDYLTNYTKPLSPKDIDVVTSQISGTESFIESLKESLKSGALQKEIDNSDAPESATPATPTADKAAPAEPASAQ